MVSNVCAVEGEVAGVAGEEQPGPLAAEKQQLAAVAVVGILDAAAAVGHLLAAEGSRRT